MPGEVPWGSHRPTRLRCGVVRKRACPGQGVPDRCPMREEGQGRAPLRPFPCSVRTGCFVLSWMITSMPLGIVGQVAADQAFRFGDQYWVTVGCVSEGEFEDGVGGFD